MKSEALQLTNGFFFSILYLFVSQRMLDAFEEIQGKFRQIRSLTRRQKDHLKRFHGGHDTSNGTVNINQILPAIFKDLNLNPVVFLIELLKRKYVKIDFYR